MNSIAHVPNRLQSEALISERERQALLARLHILDTPPEWRFDRVTELARELFRTPIALMSLLDEERQWFKSAAGLTGLTETPRSIALCEQTLRQDRLLVVPDCLLDDRFRHNPLVTGEPHIRFYAGALIRVGDLAVGSLCVIDHQPRCFYENEQRLLQALADWLGWQLMQGLPQTSGGAEAWDRLTGLGSRQTLMAQLAEGLAGRSLLLLNIDHFKQVNERDGYAAGDQLLARLGSSLGRLLMPGESSARLGGDDFVVLLPAGLDVDQSWQRAMTLKKTLESCALANQGQCLRLSGGLVFDDQDLPGGTELSPLHRANLALREAKRLHAHRLCLFDPALAQRAQRLRQVSEAFVIALVDGQSYLDYQPQWRWSGQDWQIIGFEALARWRHPQLGQVSPQEFIPLAEDNGQIHALGRQVLAQALSTLHQWHRAGWSGLVMAVNVSPVQLLSANFVAEVQSLLRASGVPAHCLELEVTETAMLRDQAVSAQRLEQLHRLGVRLALDDFGTGYSSLTHIQQLPFDRIKIDRSFVRDLPGEAANLAIVEAIMGLARRLGREVVVEGVEVDSQLQCLLAQGCQLFQGYLLGRPCSEAQARALLEHPAGALLSR